MSKTIDTERPSTSNQRQYIYKLVGYDQRTKEECVQWVTGDIEKISTKDLSYQEADRLIKQLTSGTFDSAQAPAQVHPYGAFNGKNPRHRKVLSLCITYGWTSIHPKTGKQVADLERLGNWLQYDERCPVHKPLKKMDDDDLSKIIKALEGMIKWKFK